MLGLLLFGVAILILATTTRRHRSIPLAALTVTFVVFYGIRAIGLAFSLDEPFPEYLFATSDLAALQLKFGAIILVFAASVAFSYRYTQALGVPFTALLPYTRERISSRIFVSATLAFTALAALVTLTVITTFGGYQEAIIAAKSGREGSSGFLRIPATIALVLSCALFHRSRHHINASKSSRLLAFICITISAVSASAWGSRQFVVVAVAFVVGAPMIAAFRDAKNGWGIRALLSLFMIVGVGFGLRLYRDDVLGGETTVSRAEGDIFRQLSVSANGTMYDSSLLASRDWPARFEWRDGTDFLQGIWAAVPSPLRPETQESTVSLGAAFHDLYEPGLSNGWPIGAPLEWYINFGFMGVALGGLLSGLVYSALDRAHRRSKEPELASIVTLVLVLIVFPLGLSATSPQRFAAHAVPLLIVLASLVVLSKRHTSESRRPGQMTLTDRH